MAHKVKPGRNGRQVVEFNCGFCNADLESPLEEAGQRFDCPNCRQPVVTPGEFELKRMRAERQVRLEQRQADAARAAAEPTPVLPITSAAAGPLAGFLADDEAVLASLGPGLTLTNLKLIQFRRTAAGASVSLPLESVNFASVSRSRALAWTVLLSGAGNLPVALAEFVERPPEVVAGLFLLVTGAALVLLGLYLMRRKHVVFSSAGGLPTFAYLTGSLVGTSHSGIVAAVNCPDADLQRFMAAFFNARQTLVRRDRDT